VWARNQVTNACGVQGFTHDQVAKIVASDAFAEAWVQANRAAHAELVSALTGKGGNGAVTVKDDTVSVNLAPFIQTIKAQLVDSGFSLAAKIPEVNTSFVVFQSTDITRARSAFDLPTTLGNWLPWVALVLLAIGVYVARDHRRGNDEPQRPSVPNLAARRQIRPQPRTRALGEVAEVVSQRVNDGHEQHQRHAKPQQPTVHESADALARQRCRREHPAKQAQRSQPEDRTRQDGQIRCICRSNTRFSKVVRTKATKVNSPRRNTAGSTAATRGRGG